MSIPARNSQKGKPMTGGRQRVAIAAVGLLVVAGTLASAYAAPVRPTARTAASQNVKDEARLHVTRTNGSLLIEEGQATGQIPGKVKASFEIESSVTSNFTIYARGGSITGHGEGRLHSTGPTSSFAGSLKITGGTGRYNHAHGTGGFYGTINRKTYAATVQTTGTLYY